MTYKKGYFLDTVCKCQYSKYLLTSPKSWLKHHYLEKIHEQTWTSSIQQTNHKSQQGLTKKIIQYSHKQDLHCELQLRPMVIRDGFSILTKTNRRQSHLVTQAYTWNRYNKWGMIGEFNMNETTEIIDTTDI
jgi:hypothetical protein